jgi:thiol:disulfide interchange protein DsbD
VLWRQSIARATPDAMPLTLELEYQGCAEAGLCYNPVTVALDIDLPETGNVTALGGSSGAPISEQGKLAALITGSSIWVTVGAFFAIGLGLAFTPCVLPMVPILSGIIAGDGDNVSPKRGFTLALAYVLGMAIVYTLAGIVAAKAGANLQAIFNQPAVLIVFASLFVVLALAMFGVYELQMPSAIQSKLSAVSGNQKSGTMVGAFVMGAISSLVVTACVAPALIAALTVMAQTGDVVRGGTALFAMSLGMGAPLLAVGAAQGQLLPKAGAWMVAVKGAFGFMFIGLAIWMLSRILPGSITMLLWGLLAVMVGVFMGGLTSIGTDSTAGQKLGKGFGVVTIVYGLALFIGVLAGGSNPLKPLDPLTGSRIVAAGGADSATVDTHAMFKRIKSSADLDEEIRLAAASGKSVLLDFYADWCVSCKEMEAFTFPDPAVRDALGNTVMLQADVTANDAIDKELLDRFGVFGPPTIIFFGSDGLQRHGYEVVGYMKAADFASHVSLALGTEAVAADTP